MSEVKTLKFKQTPDNKHWYVAKVQINGTDYTINMMRFEEPSGYGIAEGKISKLFVFSRTEEALWYDREWIRTTPKNNTTEIQKLYETIIANYN